MNLEFGNLELVNVQSTISTVKQRAWRTVLLTSFLVVLALWVGVFGPNDVYADKKKAAAGATKIQTITIDVPAAFEGLAAIGVVIVGEQTYQFPGAEVTRATPELLTVRYSLDRSQFPDGSFASAIVVGARGAKAYGPLRPIGPTTAQTSIADIPLCPPEKIKIANAENQRGVLQSLYDVRLARRTVLSTKLQRILTPELITRINSLERGFGLDRATPISAATNPAELIDRVSRIRNSVAQYRQRKDTAKR